MKNSPLRRRFLQSSSHWDDALNIWVTTYGDMMTFLMVFFLILWAYTQFIRQKIQTAPRPDESAAVKHIREELTDVGTVALAQKKVTVTLPSAVLFDSGKAELKEAALGSLKKIVTALSQSTAPVVVEGHTDDIPIQRSKWRSDYELSSARAFSVIRFFTEQGLAPSRLTARGYGPFHPVIKNSDDETRARNRRIEIQFWVSG